ncbi:MAG: thiamine phosphate synthase, partial [Peptoniphilaceae bacterium]|nr:thiamine phosphate synthase [Peptoniphilaceae bacterium]
MKLDRKKLLLYAVTDRRWEGKENLYEQLENALIGGVTCVQLREKEMSEVEFLNEAEKIKILCNNYN